MWRLISVLFACSFLFIRVEATITIGERHFQSMPAVFGKPFSLVGSYDTAHLQLLQADNPFLCQRAPENERHLRTVNVTQHIIPTDGLPIAVLVSRGACSFEEKARTAMELGFIQYVIVYDDRARAALVPMSATDPDGITVGMLFVSQITGMQLRRMILDEPASVTAKGGIVIEMDARSPPLPPNYEQTQQWMLAAMAGFFTFMSCFGCLMVGIQMGYIPANGRIVIGGTGIHSARPSRRLLTEAQVRRLPHEVYVKQENEEQHGCAICIDEYQDGDSLQVLPCTHKFHSDCIVPWLTERQASCPLCKHDITRSDLLEEGEELNASRGWFWSSLRRSDRLMVPTEDEDSVETPPSSPTRAALEEHSPPVSPLGASAHNDGGDTEALVPSEAS
jgi:hypothetical protein